jgi:cytochrome subunit of sulfide dehydrogenase
LFEIKPMEIFTMFFQSARTLSKLGLGISAAGLLAVSAPAMSQSTASNINQMSLAATCANCHGTNGVGVPNAGMPQINHLSSEAMLTQLKAFKSGARTGTIMHQLAKGYTDEQLQTISNILGKK